MVKVKNPSPVVEDLPCDDQPDDGKLEAVFKKVHNAVKSKIKPTDEAWIKGEIAKAEKASSNQLNTAEFRKFAFRQGAACTFPELAAEKEETKDDNNDELDDDAEKPDDAQPQLKKHF